MEEIEARVMVCECKALRAHTRISAIQVSLIIIIKRAHQVQHDKWLPSSDQM
jgi:hypothetical protein